MSFKYFTVNLLTMNSQLTQAKKYCREGDFKNALKSIGEVTDHDFGYWILYCEICIELNMFEKADDAISNAIHIDNASDYAWYLKAKVCIGLLDYKKARRACLRALSINVKEEYVSLKTNIEYFLNASRLPRYMNRYDNMVELTKKENIDLLSERKLNEFAYRMILDDMVKDAIDKTEREGDILTKIRNFTRNFIDIDLSFESCDLGDKRRLVGAYAFNAMKIDSNALKTYQISIMIHELAHHLLSEIFKHAMMYVYDSAKTDTIEAFASYCIIRDVYWRLMNEYCAHAVECHYMPYNYTNYESFNLILSRHDDLNEEKIKKSVIMANSLAEDMVYMIDKFIDDDLKEEIKMQYLSDRIIPARRNAVISCDEKYDDEIKFEMINYILRENLLYVKINLSYSELYRFKRIFTKVNGDKS